MVGKTISHYKITEKLGEGGMGEVYLADDTKLKRQVAIKLLPSRITINETDKARFLQEAQAAAAINHPNVCVIYDIKEHDGQQFIVMEYIDGVTLSDKIASKPLPIEQAIEYAIQIGSALHAAHEKEIIHRDIKSDNIMISATNKIKVMDFGLAKIKGSVKLTKTTSTVGTLAYMSPEQIEGKEIDARGDIFSYGVVLYEMLAGKLPFKGEYESALMYSILNEAPEPIQKIRPDISSELMHVLNRSLEKDSNDRYKGIDDLLIDLKRVKIDYQKTELKPVAPSVQKATKRKMFNLKQLAGVFIILIIIIGSIYIFNLFSSKPEQQLKTIPFTSLSGGEYNPVFSPDGNHIAFSWNGENQDNYDIYVKSIGSESLLRLTNHKGDDWSPEWSPDGQYIAFCRNDEGEMGIYKVPAKGGAEQQLHAGSWKGLDNLSWSPDSQFIAISGQLSTHEPFSIYLLSVKQLELNKLTSPPIKNKGDYDCSFSPDGKMIVFYRNVSVFTGDIYIMSVPDGEPTQLTFDKSRIDGLSWTHTGSEIVFSSNRGGNFSLWRISTNGGEAKPLGINGHFPTISRRGDNLAYLDLSSNANIYRIAIPKSNDKQTIAQKFISSSRWDYQSKFSPDGSRIVFASMRSGTFEIWTCDRIGQNLKKITSIGGAFGGAPSWSPDGRKIAFDNRQEGHCDIFVVNAEGGVHQRITTSESEDNDACWSKDGEWIYFASNRSGESQIWKISSNGGRPFQVTTNGGYAPRISVDGKWIFYSRSGSTSEIFKIPEAGGDEMLVFNVQVNWFDWCLGNNGLYYINRKEGDTAIEFLDFQTNQIKRVVDVEIKGWAHLNVSPDGQWLLYNHSDQDECDIMLVKNFH